MDSIHTPDLGKRVPSSPPGRAMDRLLDQNIVVRCESVKRNTVRTRAEES